jgi:DNA-binding NtrC family response regulator
MDLETRGTDLAKQTRILIASGDRGMRQQLAAIVAAMPADVSVAETGVQVVHLAQIAQPHIVVTDLPLPDMAMIDLLARLKEQAPDAQVIVLRSRANVSEAVDAMRAGAYTLIELPVERDPLLTTLRKALEEFRLRSGGARLGQRTTLPAIVGRAPALDTLLDTVQRVAPSDANCLIVGENGTGKELVADAIHASSGRAGGPFVKINCAAIPGELLESELFGHKKGAFTGAIADREGLFGRANGGSLFLDEIAEMAFHLQAKLLRVLQEREFRPIGSGAIVPLDVRLICATNAHIDRAINERRLREDLLFRINTVTLQVPPLRERMDDLPLLCSHYLDKFMRQYQRDLQGFSAATMLALSRYHWPGNVRELQNVIEQAVLLTRTGEIDLSALPQSLRHHTHTPPPKPYAPMTLVQIERRAILEALRRANWKKEEAAMILGLHPATLEGKMQKYSIEDPYRRRRRGQPTNRKDASHLGT